MPRIPFSNPISLGIKAISSIISRHGCLTSVSFNTPLPAIRLKGTEV